MLFLCRGSFIPSPLQATCQGAWNTGHSFGLGEISLSFNPGTITIYTIFYIHDCALLHQKDIVCTNKPVGILLSHCFYTLYMNLQKFKSVFLGQWCFKHRRACVTVFYSVLSLSVKRCRWEFQHIGYRYSSRSQRGNTQGSPLVPNTNGWRKRIQIKKKEKSQPTFPIFIHFQSKTHLFFFLPKKKMP